jgi:hypothetical protein
MTVPTIDQAAIDSIKPEEEHENGDLYDEDLGIYLATVDLKNDEKEITMPARLSLFIHGYWYIFTPVGRYKHEEKANEETKPA